MSTVVDRLVHRAERGARLSAREWAQYAGVLAERTRRPSLHRKNWSRNDGTNPRMRSANPRAREMNPRALRAVTMRRSLDLLDGRGGVPAATIARWEAEGSLRPLVGALGVDERLAGMYAIDAARAALAATDDDPGEPP